MSQPLAVGLLWVYHLCPVGPGRGVAVERNGAVIKAAELESVTYAAERLGVSRQRIHQMFQEGKLDWYRIGKRRLVHKRDIERLCRSRQSGKVA